jgi:hypothetical protein
MILTTALLEVASSNLETLAIHYTNCYVSISVVGR